jgi:hypothetical protein
LEGQKRDKHASTEIDYIVIKSIFKERNPLKSQKINLKSLLTKNSKIFKE